METSEIILELLLGGLLGLTGQMLRVIVGLKKVNDAASQQQTSFKNVFETSKLVISLIIGFVAGILAVISLSTFTDKLTFSKQTILTIAAAGYAGTDFIEGFIKKFLPGSDNGAAANNNGGAPAKGQINQPVPKH